MSWAPPSIHQTLWSMEEELQFCIKWTCWNKDIEVEFYYKEDFPDRHSRVCFSLVRNYDRHRLIIHSYSIVEETIRDMTELRKRISFMEKIELKLREAMQAVWSIWFIMVFKISITVLKLKLFTLLLNIWLSLVKKQQQNLWPTSYGWENHKKFS